LQGKPKQGQRRRVISPGGTPYDAYEKGGPTNFAKEYGTYKNYATDRKANERDDDDKITRKKVSRLSTGKRDKAGKWKAELPEEEKIKRRRSMSTGGTP